jgi:hypothetical protein
MSFNRNVCWYVLGLLVFVSVLGCGRVSPEDALAEANDTNMKKLANLYFTYQMKHDWKGPKSEEDFRKFIEGFDAAKLKRIGIESGSIEGLFSNDRDGKPFKIRYGVAGSAMGSSAAVIFEEEGVGGQRMVGFLNMEQRQVDDAEYDQLWSSAPSKKVAPLRSGEAN